MSKFWLELSVATVVVGGLVGWISWRQTPEYRTLEESGYYATFKGEPVVDQSPPEVLNLVQSTIGVMPLSRKESWESSNMGSAWVIAPGYAITNRHVIDFVKEIDGSGYNQQATLYYEQNGQSFVDIGKVVCVSSVPESDLALIKLPASMSNLQPVRMPDSFALPQPGTEAYAIGNSAGIYGNVRGTAFATPAEPKIEVSYPNQAISFDTSKLVHFEAAKDGSWAVKSGGSGGLVADATGTAWGVVFAARDRGDGFAISLPTLMQWVDTALQDPTQCQAVQPSSDSPPVPESSPESSILSSGEAAAQAVFRMGGATGWKLDRDDLGMTAAHVIEAIGRSGRVKSETGATCRFQTVKVDNRLDLALLKLEGDCASLPGLPATAEINEGESMTAIGYPGVFGGQLAINEGTIKAIGTISTAGRPDVETSDQILYAGMSGGPCFTQKGAFGVVSNGTNPTGQMRPGDRGWCAPIPEGWIDSEPNPGYYAAPEGFEIPVF